MTTTGSCGSHKCLGQGISVFSSLSLWADVFHLYTRFNPSSISARLSERERPVSGVFSRIWKFC